MLCSSNRRTALQNYFAQRREQRHPLTWKAIDMEQEYLQSAEDAALDEKLKPMTADFRRRGIRKRDHTGFCLRCGRKLTFCGLPFTAEIPCPKCLCINVYKNSLKPIAVRP